MGGINLDGSAPKTDADIVCTKGNGWCRRTTATVKLTAGDQAGLSGIKGIHYKLNNASWAFAQGANKDVNVPLAGNGTVTVLFYGEDNAGNVETQNGVGLKYDTIAPVVTHTLNPAANALDWNNSDVTVTFNASDDSDGSGVDPATVTPPVTVSTETPATGIVVAGKAFDMAGNEASPTVGNINIDAAAPTVTVTGVVPGGIYTLGSVPTGCCTATDVGPSGLDGSCQFTVTGGTATGVSTFNYTATAKDMAGNVTTVTGGYTVRYPVVTYSTTFWLQPINDTAHTKDNTTSVFKAGRTVPAKFRIVDANGKSIQTATPPQWITPAKGSATTARWTKRFTPIRQPLAATSPKRHRAAVPVQLVLTQDRQRRLLAHRREA